MVANWRDTDARAAPYIALKRQPGPIADEAFQTAILPGVSRTFALTIPQLPNDLCRAVTNAYLLCRIADTIEDDARLTLAQKEHFHETFLNSLESEADAQLFSATLPKLLSDNTLPDEKELMRNTHRVVRVTRSLNPNQQAAVTRCVRIMSDGMRHFERTKGPDGLASLTDLERYCYFVAGVVGEMLTELFCDYSEEIGTRRGELMGLAVAFGQGLQMTNILKDVWDDYQRGTCWLPRDVFDNSGFNLSELETRHCSPEFGKGIDHLVGVAHQCLRGALRYTQLMPPHETGIRRFCLWAIGLAVLTLRKIYRTPWFTSGGQVKVSRRTVKAVIFASNVAVRSNTALGALFQISAKGLPLNQTHRISVMNE